MKATFQIKLPTFPLYSYKHFEQKSTLHAYSDLHGYSITQKDFFERRKKIFNAQMKWSFVSKQLLQSYEALSIHVIDAICIE